MKILLYPDANHPKWDITKLKHFFAKAKIEIASSINENFDAAIYWSYHKTKREHDTTIKELNDRCGVINFGCDDISKSKVERIMFSTFGYNTIINPETSSFFGEKSELQGRHSIVEKTKFEGYKENCIYVKILDGRINPTTTRDFRIYVFGSKISLVVTKDKPIEQKYMGAAVAELKAYKNPQELFSEKEIENILDFCTFYGVQITELDAMRDSDGRLYIIDNNNVSAFADKEKELLFANNGYLLNYLSKELKKFLKKWTL